MTAKAGRYVAGAAAGLAIALSLTACNDAAPDKAAPAGKPAAGGVRLTAAQEALGKASSRTSGVTSFKGAMSLSMNPAGQPVQMNGAMAFRLKPAPAMRLDFRSMDVGGRKVPGITEILVGDKLYMKIPGLDARTGKPWASVPFNGLSAVEGLNPDSLSQSDPSMNAKMLTASKDVRLVGKETVGGVSTSHYRGTFDMQAALAKLSSEQRAQAQESYKKMGLTSMSFDIWIDGRQLPRKMTMASPPSAATAMKLTMTYSAFNVRLAIAAPPKSQVADGSGLLGGGGANVPG